MIPVNKTINNVLATLNVSRNVTNAKRLGKFDANRGKPRTVLVHVASMWELKNVLARSKKLG